MNNHDVTVVYTGIKQHLTCKLYIIINDNEAV